MINVIHRYEPEVDKKETLSKICDCTSKVGKASVENTAFLRALGVEKGLNVGKYREEVESELKEDAKKGIYCQLLIFVMFSSDENNRFLLSFIYFTAQPDDKYFICFK